MTSHPFFDPTARAASLVRLWTRLYTARMRPDVRDTRRAEIASDLWESLHAHADANARPGAGSFIVAAQMIARLVAGMPHDLLWRSEHPADEQPASSRLIAVSAAALVLLVGTLWMLPVLQAEQPPALPAPPFAAARPSPLASASTAPPVILTKCLE